MRIEEANQPSSANLLRPTRVGFRKIPQSFYISEHRENNQIVKYSFSANDEKVRSERKKSRKMCFRITFCGFIGKAVYLLSERYTAFMQKIYSSQQKGVYLFNQRYTPFYVLRTAFLRIAFNFPIFQTSGFGEVLSDHCPDETILSWF